MWMLLRVWLPGRKENAVASGLGDAPIRWLVDDCVKFVEREIRRGNHYDAIIMDPPSYGRGPKGEIWKIEDCIHDLIKLCTKILSDEPLFFLINSYTTGLAPAVLTYMLSTELKKFGGHVDSQEIGLPVSSNGLVLPCGASGRWERRKVSFCLSLTENCFLAESVKSPAEIVKSNFT